MPAFIGGSWAAVGAAPMGAAARHLVHFSQNLRALFADVTPEHSGLFHD